MTTKKTYPLEFRAEAVKLILEQGLSQGEAAHRLSIPKGHPIQLGTGIQ